MTHQSPAARQLAFAYRDPPGSASGRRESPAPIGDQPRVCAICQTRQVMVQRQRERWDLFHTLCFRCYHRQMEHRRMRMTRPRRSTATLRASAAGPASGREMAPCAPKYQELDHRRRQAQMAARRALDRACQDDDAGPVRAPARREARTAGLAGRA